MIELAAIPKGKTHPACDLLVLPFYKGEKAPTPAFSHSLEEVVRHAISLKDFSGKEGELLLLYPKVAKDKRLLLVGLGKEKTCTAESLRLTGSCVAKFCKQKKLATIAVDFPDKAFSEGLLHGAYSFNALKGTSLKEDAPVFLKKAIFLNAPKSFEKELEKLGILMDTINFARDLINNNADDVNAETLAETVRQVARTLPTIKTTFVTKTQLEKEHMGLMLAVNRGAIRDPVLVLLEYTGDPKSKDVTALIGKGVTYDTGGLNIKVKGTGMETMKADMSGAAAVLGILKAAAMLKLKVNLLGAMPLVENAIGPNSFKPGDVYKSRSGQTVEIIDTDAEGRLILADTLSYVQDHYSPSRMVDFATLTGGIVVALGEAYSGLFCNDDHLAKQLFASGESSGDLVWRMPLDKVFREPLRSRVADIKNVSGRKGSPCMAAAFLQTFIQPRKEGKGEPVPWAHLDIAGTAYYDDPHGYHTTCATGAGIRLMIDFFERF